jgi:hypothetical protein
VYRFLDTNGNGTIGF